ncbi:MAG: ATP-dependent Clp protease adaptor ClpS [Bacteroidia bacterium]|jgi:ATP-dependent Clp protease adaptor protein ClpS|nr:ATP-dependent Clp protease adaptor ClpS [Bacteroidota bacterium]MBP6513111.1 ATP-dependent Clp protease adaptor ClpS [Bacteroidia bacterium]MBP7245373.1 ATP-dependent Clp protease adaptor ClpS [Bacteroidia bacterium]
MSNYYSPQEQEDLLLQEEVVKENQIILYNDDVNTFDWVIDSLVSICSHDREQAEQCSVIIHHHGKCSVKIGEIDRLRPMCEALLDRGLSATIE